MNSEYTALLQEIKTLPPSCVSEVLDFVAYLKRKNLRELTSAAAMMAAEYAADPELTAFCALDGEDFYETR